MSTKRTNKPFLSPFFGLIVFLLINVLGCRQSYDLPEQDAEDHVQLYMPQARLDPALRDLAISEKPQEIVYGAYLGGIHRAQENIRVQFSVDPSAIDAYNTANGTAYTLLPERSYTLSATEAVIPAGEFSTAAQRVSFRTSGSDAMELFKAYALPIKISSEQMKINPEMQTTLLLVRAAPRFSDYAPYNRSGWSITGFSTEEAEGEGPNNGRARFVLDGNNDSFWHSRWRGTAAVAPHYLTVDMGEARELHGIITRARRGGDDGKPREVTVSVSADQQTWEQVGAFTLENNDAEQQKFVSSFRQCRYFRLTIVSSYNASHTHLAELGAF